MKTALIVAALVVLGLYATGLGLLVLLQRRFIYVPDKNRPDLAAAGIPNAREITVHTGDGLDLLAWLVPPDDETQPVILCLHGNAGHIGNRASWMTRLHGFGWGVLLLEYRGYGGNPGEPTESGLIEDARAGYAALRGIGIPGNRILLWGDSLGTGVAVRLATEVEVGAVMLESPYTSIVAIGQRRFPFAPVAWLLRDRFDSIGRIPMVRSPVLVMTGGRDEVVPPEMGRAVFAAAPEPKVFWLAPDAGHDDLAAAGAFDVARRFVQEHWKAIP
jgi:fermentation-respiration switch protein FrsA (DUF1100 family)